MKIARITNDGKLLLAGQKLTFPSPIYNFDGTDRVDIKPFVSPENNMFNNESFVFECEVNHSNGSGARTIYSDTANDQFSYNRIAIQNSKVVIQFINQGANELTLTSTQTVSANEWVKIKVVRSGFDFTIFINDVEDATGIWNKGNWSYAPIASNSATNCSLGVTYFGWNFMNPFIGEMRNINLIPVSGAPRLTNNGDLYINDIVEVEGDDYFLNLPMNNSQVIVPYNPVLHLSSAFTICLWFKLNNVASLKQLLGQGAWGTSWTFWISGGRPLLTLNSTHYFSPNNVAVANEWQHMVISYNAGEIKHYWNGQYLSTLYGITNFTGTTHNLFFNYTQYPYNGGLKDARIFNRVLTNTEVESIYNNTNHAVGDEILWLPFNEGEGNIANDISGNGNHGTISNGEWLSEPVNIKLKDGVLYVSELIENAIL